MESFRFSADIVKAEAQTDGTYVLEGLASLPGKDLQREEVDPQGLDIDYFLGKGLPKGAGGYINLDHDPHTIVGYPEEGKIGPQGFWVKWRTINTPLVQQLMEQIKALKEAGWPRRYGMSIEGVVQERDPADPQFIRRAFIRNVALTPTPVHPGTFVDFAKSLTPHSRIGVDPRFGVEAALRGWVQDTADIVRGVITPRRNPYFHPDGRLRATADQQYFRDVWGVTAPAALELAHYAARHETALRKSLQWAVVWDATQRHLQRQRRRDPTCPHLTASGHIQGGDHAVAAHFLTCEGRSRAETVRMVRVLHGSPLVVNRKETHA